MSQNIKEDIENFWNEKDNLNFTQPDIKQKIIDVLSMLDMGELRVCKNNKIYILKEQNLSLDKVF